MKNLNCFCCNYIRNCNKCCCSNQCNTNWYWPYRYYGAYAPMRPQGYQGYVAPIPGPVPYHENKNCGICNGILTNIGLPGISLTTSGVTEEVADGGVIPLNVLTNGNNGSGTSGTNLLFDSINHTITIQQTGNYYVSWGAVIDGIAAVGSFLELTLFQSYNATTPVTYSSCGNRLQAQIVGNTMITVNGSPTILSLLNTSGYAIDLAQVKVQAWLNVIALNGAFTSTRL